MRDHQGSLGLIDMLAGSLYEIAHAHAWFM
jgi:hypothetical protein